MRWLLLFPAAWIAPSGATPPIALAAQCDGAEHAQRFARELQAAAVLHVKARGEWLLERVPGKSCPTRWRIDVEAWLAKDGSVRARTSWSAIESEGAAEAPPPPEQTTTLHVLSDGKEIRSWFEGDAEGTLQPQRGRALLPFPLPASFETFFADASAPPPTAVTDLEFRWGALPATACVGFIPRRTALPAGPPQALSGTWLAFDAQSGKLIHSCALDARAGSEEVLHLAFERLELLNALPAAEPAPTLPPRFVSPR